MSQADSPARLLPDVARHAQPHVGGTLDWVGMAEIQVPVQFDAGDGTPQRNSARVGAFVNLRRPEQRGIHMSRLYLLVDQSLTEKTLDAPMLRTLLSGFLESHAELSDRARIGIRFEQLIRRPALRSGHAGWRAYPVSVTAELDTAGFRCELSTQVLYSSTCPASAALSRQLIQEQFARDFDAGASLDHARVLAWLGSEQGIVATPHAQRSVAELKLRFAADAPLNLLEALDRVEAALGTPVQTAVKRADEQAFALANGGNLMFCEDAARRVQRALDAAPDITDFDVRVAHLESLHPHDAVACASKGVPGGFGEGR